MKILLSVILITILFAGVLVMGTSSVLAEEATPSTGIRGIIPALKERFANQKEKIQTIRENKQEKVEELKEKREEKREERKENIIERVRKAAQVRWEVHVRAVTVAENLLDKLQERIDRAKASGKDTAEMEKLMADARISIADAKLKLDEIKSKKDTAVEKVTFAEIQREFQDIRRDLHVVRVDASQIIRLLKGFNSATSEGTKSAVKKIKEGTPSSKSSSAR